MAEQVDLFCNAGLVKVVVMLVLVIASALLAAHVRLWPAQLPPQNVKSRTPHGTSKWRAPQLVVSMKSPAISVHPRKQWSQHDIRDRSASKHEVTTQSRLVSVCFSEPRWSKKFMSHIFCIICVVGSS